MFTQLHRDLKYRIKKELERYEELAKHGTPGAYREPEPEPGPIAKSTVRRPSRFHSPIEALDKQQAPEPGTPQKSVEGIEEMPDTSSVGLSRPS